MSIKPVVLSRAERAELLLELRFAEDPCRQFVPTPTQKRISECRKRYIGVRGVNRSGKSSFGAWLLASCARRIHPQRSTTINGLYVVFAPSREQITDPWYKKLREDSELVAPDGSPLFSKPAPFIPDYEIADQFYTHGAGEPTVKMIMLKNGQRIMFMPSADRHVWKRLEGKGMILGILFDESAGSQQLVDEAGARLLDANSNPQVREQAGGGWIYWSATENKKTMAFEQYMSRCDSNDPQFDDMAAFTLSPTENPAIDQREREKLKALMSDDAYRIRMAGGTSITDVMAVYPQWQDERNWLKEDYIPADTDNLWAWYDPGTNYAGMVLAAIRKEAPRTFYVIKVWQWHRTTLEAQLHDLRQYLQGRFLEGFTYDQAARIVSPVGESVIMKIQRLLKQERFAIRIQRGLLKGRSRYEDTVPLVRTALEEGRIKVNSGPLTGGTLLRQQIRGVCFTGNAYELKMSNIQVGDDHTSDCLRYGMSLQVAWVARPSNPKLWGPGTGAHDPHGENEPDQRVLCENAYQGLQAATASPTMRRRLAMAKKMRSR